jgi:ribosomal protein L37AE/L43A
MNPACPNCKAVHNVNRQGPHRFQCANCNHIFQRATPLPQKAAAVETGWINIILSVN